MPFPADTTEAALLAYADPRTDAYAAHLAATGDDTLVKAFVEVSMAAVVDTDLLTAQRWDMLKAEILRRMAAEPSMCACGKTAEQHEGPR